MLEINNLHAQIEEKEILKGINLSIKPGEVHAVMGPNGSGKSTLANVLAGHEDYVVTSGSVSYKGKNLLKMPVEERARQGLLLTFQHPVEIPGVANMYMLKSALNAKRIHQGEEELDAMDFLELVKEKAKAVGMDEKLLQRSVNDGFSGGEKKRNEILQMLVLEPELAILDEIDSGLDVDALRDIANIIEGMRVGKRSFLLVTHYQRLLNYIVPDKVHVISKGHIARSGEKELALELEEKGYGWIEEEEK